jgi:hypothetical protein
MIAQQNKVYLQVFVNTFADSSIECIYSRRLKYLMESKRNLIDIHFIDVNIEMKNVFTQSVTMASPQST